jgi:hypothetical protein
MMDDYSSTSNNELRFFLLGFVGLIIFMVFVSQAFPSRQTPPTPEQIEQQNYRNGIPNYMNKPEEAQQRVDRLLKETNSDYAKLSKSDMEWLDSMTSGNGYRMFTGRVKANKDKAAKEKARKEKQKKASKKTAEEKKS